MYNDWAVFNKLRGFRIGAWPSVGQVAEIIIIAPHSTTSSKYLYGIRAEDGAEYIYDIGGIELYEKHGSSIDEADVDTDVLILLELRKITELLETQQKNQKATTEYVLRALSGFEQEGTLLG